MTGSAPSSTGPAPSRELLGVPIAPLTITQALDQIDGVIARRSRILIGVVNAAKIVQMHREPGLRQAVLAADLILADGMSVVWAGRLLGRPLPERVARFDLMFGMLRRGRERGYRFYCLGATEEVLDKAVARIEADFSGVRIVGRHHGYFDTEDEPRLAEEIRASQADILLVAVPSPKTEEFLGRWHAELGVRVCHGVGGSFDILAGHVRRAPRPWQQQGLEWLYRVLQEPGRLWKRYLTTNVVFSWLVLTALVRGMPSRLRRREGPDGS